MFVNFSKIELALEKKGWNQQDLANASGVSQANISRYIRGKQKPGIEILSKIAHALGIKITDLVDENKPSIYTKEKVLNKEDYQIIESWRTLSPEQKNLTKKLIDQMINNTQAEIMVKKKSAA